MGGVTVSLSDVGLLSKCVFVNPELSGGVAFASFKPSFVHMKQL